MENIKIKYTDSKTLLIVFTGFKGQLGKNSDRFLQMAKVGKATSIILYDPTRTLYMNGINEELSSFSKLVYFLQVEVKKKSPKRLFILGLSGGGYPALLIGTLLKANKVVVFSPFTYVSRELGERYEDPAITKRSGVLKRLEKLSDDVKKYFDLKPLIESGNGKTKYYIHIPIKDEWDTKRALYLKGLPNVSIIKHPYEDHGVITKVIHNRKLNLIFDNNQFSEFNEYYKSRGMSTKIDPSYRLSY